MITIALDAMGGDHAPDENILGAYRAIDDLSINVILVGQEDVIKKCIKKHNLSDVSSITICNAEEIVGMDESPSLSFRSKKKSSIRIGLNLVKEKKADAFVSSGNTGAVMATSSLVLGRCKNVERPAITTIIPSMKDPLIMLDMGSNVDCKPKYLAQFAVMGSYFSEVVFNKDKPRVGLLNIGEESYKGNTLTQSTYELLKEDSRINFIGNIESRYILKGDVDVVVCDGFVGNSLLKFGEGVSELFFTFFKSEWKQSFISKIGLLFLNPGLKRFKRKFDYQETGGAPLLGVNGVSIVAHGKSNSIAIKNALKVAHKTVESNMVATMEKAFSDDN